MCGGEVAAAEGAKLRLQIVAPAHLWPREMCVVFMYVIFLWALWFLRTRTGFKLDYNSEGL